jgi:hypothetical protein
VVSCSLEAFWSCYSVLKFAKKKLSRKKLQQKKQKEMKKSNNKEGTLSVFSFPLCGDAL